MVGLTEQQRYFLYQGACDMRKSFNGLSGLVRNEMHGSLLSGDVFVFVNRRRNQMKILFWESGGFWVYHKRLEQGRFELPDSKSNELSWQKLLLIVRGIDLKSVRQRKRYCLSQTTKNAHAKLS